MPIGNRRRVIASSYRGAGWAPSPRPSVGNRHPARLLDRSRLTAKPWKRSPRRDLVEEEVDEILPSNAAAIGRLRGVERQDQLGMVIGHPPE